SMGPPGRRCGGTVLGSVTSLGPTCLFPRDRRKTPRSGPARVRRRPIACYVRGEPMSEQSHKPPALRAIPAALREADAYLKRVADVARLLPALTATNAVEERARLVTEVRAGGVPTPRWELRKRRVDPELWRSLDVARERVSDAPGRELYLARLDELELELSMIEVLGDPRRVRPLAARRFGDGRMTAELPGGPVPLARLARGLLES